MEAEALLERARVLAERGRGIVEPNPLVGALALVGDQVVGEGWHRRYGGPHAEEIALEAAIVAGHEPDALVVTLEPCSSLGVGKRRPPCTKLILEAGIRTVVVGALDPDPRHCGTALEVLTQRGVQVLGPFPTPALEDLLHRFRRGLSRDRPWVVGKWAMTLDGKTATHTGSSRWISGESALDWAHELRAASDAVLVGIRTALEDDPELTVRRVGGEDPLRVVLDDAGDLPARGRLFETVERAPVLVLVSDEAPTERVEELEAHGATVRILDARSRSASGRPRIALPEALRLLREEFRIRRLLVEGGGETLARFFEAEAIDEVASCIAPKLIGGRGAATPLAGAGLDQMSEAWELTDVRIDTIGECVRVVGFVEYDETESGDSDNKVGQASS